MNVSSIHMFGGILSWALQLGINCCVLMGVNIANEITVEKFREATVGYRENKEIAEKWVRLFNTPYFMVPAVSANRLCYLIGRHLICKENTIIQCLIKYN
ncbi:hypothetical protein RHMOL_Rhmol04G0308300 [Rhododendron molle]|uniref:Uncharacterized protein n=1 Tax=Rhododendron molle TaxID=49168 RepID=A0ACC0P6H7_RHOML|nr:hypothetical protein RHMOL_Rhmol04G0308300 [Rhododendron molle]